MIEVPDRPAFEAMEVRLREGGAEVARDGDRFITRDPSGNRIIVELDA